MSPAVVVLMLTLLLGIQPVATDLYLPALPTLQGALAAGIGDAQLTLSALVIAFGCSQLFCGPLSDRFGRRPVLLSGTALYAAASVGGALSTSIEALVAWRVLQGVAMAAAVTCGRALVRDLFEPHEGAHVMSRGLGGLGLIATACPLIGGGLVQWLNWRAVLLVPALFGAAALAFVAWRFKETLRRRDPHALRPAPLLRNWRQVLAHPTFRAWTALLVFTYGGLFFFLAGSSFVFIGLLGQSRLAYGAIVASNSIAYVSGTMLCRRLLPSRGLRGTVRLGGALSLAGGLGLAVFSLAGVQAVWAIMLPQYLYSLGHGIHQPCGQAGAIGPFPDKAGAAASLSGFAMMSAAFGVGLWLGRHLNGGSALPMTLGIAASGSGVALVAWTLVQRSGEAPPPAAVAQAA